MAADMVDWLGPVIEKELKYAVEWKRRASTTNQEGVLGTSCKQAPIIESNPVSDKLDPRRFEDMYQYNGSNLRAILKFPTTKARVVQILEVLHFVTMSISPL